MFSASSAITDELMLHERISQPLLHARPAGPQSTAAIDRRSIDQILARRQARAQRRKRVFPPDFLHGGARLEEIYPVFGERWVEHALFLEPFYDEQGELAAFSAAWFDGRFLVLEQAVADEVDDLEGHLARLKKGRRSIVQLRLDEASSVDQAGELVVNCSVGRLLELERDRLGVVRDKELCDRRAIYSRRDDVLQDSRTNLLSLICLCARLGRRVQ